MQYTSMLQPYRKLNALFCEMCTPTFQCQWREFLVKYKILITESQR